MEAVVKHWYSKKFDFKNEIGYITSSALCKSLDNTDAGLID